MALNPNILKALAGGSKASSAFDVDAANQAIGSGAQKPGAWNLGQSIIDILSTGGYASAGITRKVGENVSAIQRGDLGGLLDLLNPLSSIPAAVKGVQERRTYSENLRDLGVEDKTATWLGLALDIGLDPTTYITGGTVAAVRGAAAGTRLASAANKANATVVRSAAEAAANNLPNLNRAYVPSDAPLTKGQKLGNYLTGVLRGAEFSRAERAADISVKRINREAQRYARKNKDGNVLANEMAMGAQRAGKNARSVIAGNEALINRERFMAAVAQSPELKKKYAARLEKLNAQRAKADNVRFVDPKTGQKVSAEQAAQAAQVSKLEEASKIDPTPPNVIDEAQIDRPAGLDEVEAPIVAANQVAAEELAEAIRAQSKAVKAAARQASKVKSSYSAITDELIDYAKKTIDPATGARLFDSADNQEDLFEYIAKGLGEQKLKPTPNRLAKFSKAIGVSNDPTQSIVNLVNKTLIRMSKDLKKLASQQRIAEEANRLVRALESGFINATSGNTAAATGAVNAAEVGAKVEEAMDLEGDVAASIDDIVEETLFNNPSATAKTSEELIDAETDLRLGSAEQFIDSTDFLRNSGSETAGFRLESLLRSSIEEGSYKKFKELAAERGLTVEELLLEASQGNKAIINDPRFSVSLQAVKLDAINSEARFNTYTKITNTERVYVSKKTRTPLAAVTEEAHLGRAGDSLFRLMNIPVRTEENILMQLRRDGAKKVGDKLSDGFVPQSINVTASDISLAAINAGKGDVFAAIRYPGSKYQNVMPSNIEYAFLTMNRYLELGEEITPGSTAWDEIKKAFNEQYELAGISGGKYGKRDVDEFFIPAKHLEPGTITTKDGKKLQLQRIPDIDKKIDNAIQAMLDSSTELRSLHASRAAASLAYAAAGAVPETRQLMLGLFEFFAAREEFAGNLETLARASVGGRNAVALGIKDTPGFNELKELMKTIIQKATIGAKAFKDKEIASEASDLILNIFMKDTIGANSEALKEKLGPAVAMRLQSYLAQEVDALYDSIKLELDLTDAMGATRPSTKLTPKQTADGKDARRRQEEIRMDKAGSLVPQAIKAQEPKTIEEITNPAPLTEEGSNLSTNFAAGNADPTLAALENVLTQKIGEGTKPRFTARFLQAMSGRFGIGLGFKSIIGGIEYKNSSAVGFFNNGLAIISERAGRDIAKVDDAFKLVQQWGKDMANRVEMGRSEITFTQWAQTAKVGNVDLAIAEDLAFMVDGMFAVDPKGVPVGALSDSYNLPYFADELNGMFRIRGILDIGEEEAFKLPTKIGPAGVKYSWARAEIGPLKASATGKQFNSLTFLSNYAHAMHAVQTRIGIGQAYSSAMGRTAQEIKDEGLDPKLFMKIDTEDEFGKYLDPNKFYEISELDRMRYIKDYITYERGFGQGTMQRIVDLSDLITGVLKASNTTWRAGHHVTSIVGEAIMNSIAGVNNPKYYGNAWKLLTTYDPARYKGDANAFKAYAEYSTPKGMRIKATENDTVGYISSVTGKRTIVSEAQIYKLADELGILTRGGASTVEDLDLRGIGDIGGGAMGALSRANSTLADISSKRDNFFRMAHFIKEIEKGGIYASIDEAAIAAAKTVTTYHPTIGGLSAFERKYMRRAVYFYTWQRIAATKVFQLMIERPGVVTVPSKIQYAFAEANGFSPESFGDPWDPNGVYASWDTGSVFGPQFQGSQGEGDAMGFRPAIPQLDILQGLFGGYTMQPGQTGTDVLFRGSQNLAGQNLSPLPKWIAEGLTGDRVGSGTAIRNPLEYAIDQVGGINTISKLTGIGRDPETGMTSDEIANRDARLLINWLTGTKLQDYSTGQSLRQWSKDQREFMRRLTEQGQ